MARSAAASSPRWRSRSARFRWASAEHGWSRSALAATLRPRTACRERARTRFARRAFRAVRRLRRSSARPRRKRARARRARSRAAPQRDARERLAHGNAHHAQRMFEHGHEQRQALRRRKLRCAEHGAVDHERVGTGERYPQCVQCFLAGVVARVVRVRWRARWPASPTSSANSRSARGASSAPLRSRPSASTKCGRRFCDAGNHFASASRAQVADFFAWQPLHAFGRAECEAVIGARDADRVIAALVDLHERGGRHVAVDAAAAPCPRHDANGLRRRSARVRGSARRAHCPTAWSLPECGL